jgi:GTP-binding protein
LTGIPFVVAANKSDKVKKKAIEGQLEMIRETLHLDESVTLIHYSARTKEGIDRLKKIVFGI